MSISNFFQYMTEKHTLGADGCFNNEIKDI